MAALIVAAMAPATADAPLANPALQEEAGWIVTLADGVSPHAFGPALSQHAGGKLGFVYDEVLGGFSFDGSGQAGERLRNTPFVASVVADQIFSTAAGANRGQSHRQR